MKKSINGINPVIAVILTLVMAFLTILMFAKGRIFWGIVFCLICIDFGADLVLSLKKA